MSESGKQTPGVSKAPQTTNEVSFRTFWVRFAMLFVVASALVVALVLFSSVVDFIVVRSMSSEGFLRFGLLILVAFAPVVLAAAVLWMRDAIEKLTKRRVLNLEYISIGSMDDDLFDRFRGGEDSAPLRRVFARFLALTIATGVFVSVVYLPGIVAFAIYLLVKGEGAWAAVRVLAIGAAAILAMSVVPWLVLACLLPCAPLLSKLWDQLYPPNTTRSGSSPDEPAR
jgi:hypothetical protein